MLATELPALPLETNGNPNSFIFFVPQSQWE